MSSRIRFFGLLGTSLFALTAIAGCPKRNSSSTFKVVAILSTLGKPAAYGRDNKAGLEIARDEISSSGGMHGLPLEIAYEDTDGTPASIPNLIRKYSADPSIMAVLGPTTTDETTTAANLLPGLSQPLIMLSVGSTGDWKPNNGKFNDWTFRSTRVDSTVIPDLIRIVHNHLHPKTASIIYHPDNEYSMSVLPVYERACRDYGINVIAEEAATKAATDWSAQLTKIKDHSPDILIVNVLAGAGPKILGQSRDMGLMMPCVGTAAFTNPATWPVGGTAMEGTLVGDIFDPEIDTPEVKAFVRRYQAKYHQTPPAYAAYSHAGLTLLAQAARLAKVPTNRQSLRDALGQLKNVPTVVGTVSYNGRGDISQHPVVLQIHRGSYRRVK
jgi:branched-chain amino acid transport system substrate-binding protein